MSNTNCLAGIKCPKCGYEDAFKIEVTTVMEVTDDGTDFDGSEVNWKDDSYCECVECGRYGTVADFKKRSR